MRIVLVCTDRQAAFADPRRCPARMRGLAEAFVRAEHEVVVLAPGPQPALAGLSLRDLRLPVTTREVDWHFAQVEPDLVLEHWLPGQVACAEAAAETRVPYLLDVAPEYLDGSHDDALLATLAAASAAGSVGVLVPGEALAERVRALAGALAGVHVLPDAVRPDLLAAPDPAITAQVATRLRLGDASDLRVGFVGPLTRESGVLDLLRALAGVAEERALEPVPRLVVAGDGPARNELLALAFEHGVRLTLCGTVFEDELAAHLAACACVMAGTGDGALPLLQSMACERATLAHDTPEHRRVTGEGEAAALVRAGDVTALAAALGELLATPDRALRLARNGRLNVADGHTWCAQAERVAGLAAGLAGAGSQARTG